METSTRQSSPSPWHPLSPLAASRDADRRLLALTRKDELAIVTNMVAASRVSLLYAMSGNGKTSLINAGLVPFFTEQGYAVFTVRPRPPLARNDPRAAFRQCVLAQLPQAIHSSFDLRAISELAELVDRNERSDLKPFTERLVSLVDLLPRQESMQQAIRDSFEREPAGSLRDFLLRVSEMIGRDRPIIVVLDQFEELFVHFSNKEALSEYVDDLGEIWADSALNVRLMFSMREDWVGSMIVLRRAIPEVFKDTYRLLPLTETNAAHVLRDSLPEGETFEAAAVTRIIGDVADYYRRIEKRRLGRIEIDRSRSGERLVDLPALQIVADRLWRTRDAADRPFSLAHYEQLSPGHASPAGEILDRYLADLLSTPEEARRLQIDALYALTDGERHRRASALTVVTREIADSKLRTAEPLADEPKVHGALEPLADVSIVKRSETPEGTEYELAHDFLVRAVVGLRHQLDLDRAGERGRAEVEQKRKDERLTSLEKRDDTITTILQIAPVIGLVGLLWSTLSLAYSSNYDAVKLSIGPGLLVYIGFTMLLVAGVISRHRTSFIIAAVGLIVPIVVLIGITQEKKSVLKTVNQFRGFLRPEDATVFYSDPDSVSPADVLQLLSNSGRNFSDDVIRPLVRMTGFGLNVRTLGSALLGITFLTLLLVTLRTIATLQSSPKWSRFFLLWWADLIDILTVIIPIAAVAVTVRLAGRSEFVTIVAGVIAAIVTLLFQILIALRLCRSIGLKAAGFEITAAPFHRAIRQFVLLLWGIVNGLAMIPWLVAGSFLIFYRYASVPDLLTRRRPLRPGEVLPEPSARSAGMHFVTGKNPVLAVILSLFICGLGQFYNRDFLKGAIMLVVAIVAGLLFAPLWPVVAIWSAIDAYLVASGNAPLWKRRTQPAA